MTGMPGLARVLFVCLACHRCRAADLGDASVLAQSTLHLRKLQPEQYPYYPMPMPPMPPMLPQGPFPPMPPQQQGPYPPMPQQPPFYPPMAPPQGPYFPYAFPPEQGPYYPYQPPQAPYYPQQPQQPPQAPFFPGQPPLYPPQPPQQAPGSLPAPPQQQAPGGLPPPQPQQQAPQQLPPGYPSAQAPGAPPAQVQAAPGYPAAQAPAAPEAAAQPAPLPASAALPQQAQQQQPQQAAPALPASQPMSQPLPPVNQAPPPLPTYYAPLPEGTLVAAPPRPRPLMASRPTLAPPIIPTINDTVEIKRIKKTAWERHPRLYNTFRLLPNTKTHCFQGQKGYMEVALERLKNSPLSMQYANVTLEEGTCAETTFNKGPDYHKCFPQASLYHPFAMNRDQVLLKEVTESYLATTETRNNAVQKSWKAYTKEHDRDELLEANAEVQAMCDNGRMLEETFGLPIAAATFSITPAGGQYCVQGSKHYLENVLGQLNGTDAFRDAEVEEGACQLRSFASGPREPRCLPHASLYLASLGAGEVEERVASAHQELEAVCENTTLAHNVSSTLRQKQERANLRMRRIKEDADEQAASNFYMFDEKLYSCWQGPKTKLENVRDYFRQYGMPEWFFEKRLKIYSGGCDNMCMLNGWVERRSCVRHMRQCRHPDIDEIDPFLHKKDTFMYILNNATKERVDEMLLNADLERSCGPLSAKSRKPKGPTFMDFINQQIQEAVYGAGRGPNMTTIPFQGRNITLRELR